MSESPYSFQIGDEVVVDQFDETGEVIGRSFSGRGGVRYEIQVGDNRMSGVQPHVLSHPKTDPAGDNLIDVSLTHEDWLTVYAAFYHAAHNSEGQRAEEYKRVDDQIAEQAIVGGLQ